MSMSTHRRRGQPLVHLLIWMRMHGDAIVVAGTPLIAWFVLRLWIAPRKENVPVTEGIGAHG
ncbi:MAG: hypothetical protein P4L92_09605 [Rudaea sp.]|nr:hypothetical protein [Rudaea sp.]